MKRSRSIFPRLSGILALSFVILASNLSFAQSPWEKKAIELINSDRFSECASYLDGLSELSASEQLQKDWYLELMRRIRIEFRYGESEIKEQLIDAGLQPTDESMRHWEASRALETRLIDGERRYFKHAVSNLFRIDPELRAKASGGDRAKRSDRLNNCAEMIRLSDGAGKLTHKRTNVFSCVATVPANAVPAGEVVKYWAPFPREDCARQQDVKLISTNVKDARVAPKEDMQRCVYMEKVAVQDEPTVFEYSFQTSSYAQYFSQDYLKKNARPYDVDGELYKRYTAEYLPHMIKTEAMQKWADEIVGDETNPVEIVSLLFNAIDKRFPWASSNEYGTMFCIPEYVIREGHGDCGMLTLTLVSALRCKGIPAKWQSGWVMPLSGNGSCGMHDWGEVYFEGVGWVPIDMSYGLMDESDDPLVFNIYKSALDQCRLVINDDIGREFTPKKEFFRSEPVDFQRGEVETKDGNLYFTDWSFQMTVKTK